ncbi:hypothetical protein ACFL6R_06670 [Gemmatimonadota bacterium]
MISECPTIYRSHVLISASLLLLLITSIVLVIGCTKPDSHNPGILLLDTLVEGIPAVPLPPETASNRLNEYYLLVKQYASVVEERRESFHNLFIQIRNDWLGPLSSGKGYEWKLLHDDGISVTSFYITAGDSITFTLSHSGPSTKPMSPFTGWLDQHNNSGLVDFIDISFGGFGWFPYPEGLSMGTSDPGFSYGVIDSSTGGGRVEVWEILLDAQWFEGGWDEVGHGWCGSLFDGPDW